MSRSMKEPTPEQLKESIDELTAYRDRLHKEVITVAKKLRMPQQKIDITLENHSELRRIKRILSQLIAQKENQPS